LEPVIISLVAAAVTALFRYLPGIICALRAEPKDLPKVAKEVYQTKWPDVATALRRRTVPSRSGKANPQASAGENLPVMVDKPDHGT
jgi:hypothetical protein